MPQLQKQTWETSLNDDQAEADFLEVLIQEGDQDALLIADFEAAAQETVQDDHELATAFSAYQQKLDIDWVKSFATVDFSLRSHLLEKERDMVGNSLEKGRDMTIVPKRLCKNVSCPQHADCVEFADIGRQNVR